jgi:hypothetical protein
MERDRVKAMGTNDDGGNGGLHNSLGALLVGRRSDAANTVARGTRHLSLASHTDISSITGPCRSIPLSHDPVAGVSLTWACSDQLRFSGIYAKLQRLFGISAASGRSTLAMLLVSESNATAVRSDRTRQPRRSCVAARPTPSPRRYRRRVPRAPHARPGSARKTRARRAPPS